MNNVLLSFGSRLLPVPAFIWQRRVQQGAEGARRHLGFMSAGHHRVRDFVVLELPRRGEALSPELIAASLDLSPEEVIPILDDLEAHLTFLFRDEDGNVLWAYPVTAAPTPHRVLFSSGEQIYAAWAEDAIATPFVQGHLRNESLDFIITTKCARSGRTLHIEIDSDLNYTVQEPDARPLISMPMVDFSTLKDPSIIDAYWSNSLFFWSEEQARAYQREPGRPNTTYMTLDQAIYTTRYAQGDLFAFPRGWAKKN